MRASVVIATFRRRDNLEAVLRPLLDDPATAEVIVVVDGCRDGSLELLRRLAADEPRIRPLWTENVGPARAQQLGLEAAEGDVVVLFDDDQIAAPGMVGRHVAHHEGDPGPLLVVGYVHTPPPATRSRGSFVVERYVASYERDVARYEREPESILTGLWGGNLSMRRDALQALGWANPAYPYTYHYDQDFGLRARAAGVRAIFDRDVCAEHRFVRGVDAYFAGARTRGTGIAIMERTAPEAVAAYGVSGTPTARQRLLRSPLLPAIRGMARAIVAVAGRAGRHDLEAAVAQRLWWLELRAAYLRERRRLDGGS